LGELTSILGVLTSIFGELTSIGSVVCTILVSKLCGPIIFGGVVFIDIRGVLTIILCGGIDFMILELRRITFSAKAIFSVRELNVLPIF